MEMEQSKRKMAVMLPVILMSVLLCACGKKSVEIEEIAAGMVRIPAGEFIMGSPSGEGETDEHPQHKVYVDSFYMDVCEVTNEQFQEFVEATGYETHAEVIGEGVVDRWGTIEIDWGVDWRHPHGGGSGIDNIMDHPVVQVAWDDAVAYARWRGKRLPTEAEWEYACRAGSTTQYNLGKSISHDDANYSGKGRNDRWARTAPVGSFPLNQWGLYDMHGNVWEWCSDWYDKKYYSKSPVNNPEDETEGQNRVFRGGSWDDVPHNLRSASRSHFPPNMRFSYLGFRCVLDVE